MDPFPFTEAEWYSVAEAARTVVNATLAEDAILRASHFSDFQDVLAELRERYGDHPVLLETEADMTTDVAVQADLYRQAIDLANTHQLPTLSIRLSFAAVLLESLGQPEAARAELLACQGELTQSGDEGDRQTWERLLAAVAASDNSALDPRNE